MLLESGELHFAGSETARKSSCAKLALLFCNRLLRRKKIKSGVFENCQLLGSQEDSCEKKCSVRTATA